MKTYKNLPLHAPRQSNEGFWTEDIDEDDERPPPCYKQALKMAGLS